MRDIGKNIKSLRTQKNMTQEELAARLFVTRQTVSNYETGKSRPDVDTLFRIAEVLGADIHDILYEPEDIKAQRKRIITVAVMAVIMAVLGILLQWFVEYARVWMGRNYHPGLSVLAILILRPIYFLLLGYLFMGSVRFLQKSKPLSPNLRKWIGRGVAAGLLLITLAILPYFVSPLLSLLNMDGISFPRFWLRCAVLFISKAGEVWIFLILGLTLGLLADWKCPAQT